MKKVLVFLAAVALAGFTMGDMAFAAEEKPLTLIYQSVYPKGHLRYGINEEMLDTIESQSKGRIKFDRHYTEPVSQKRTEIIMPIEGSPHTMTARSRSAIGSSCPQTSGMPRMPTN